MRELYPSVPAYATLGTMSPTDLLPIPSGQLAGDTPAWFDRMFSFCDLMETFLSDLSTPTRVSGMPFGKLAAEGFLSIDTYALPVRDILPVDFQLTPIGNSPSDWGSGPGWWFSKDEGTVELSTNGKPVNWACVDTFGEGSIRLRTGTYDSGWLPTSSWAREVHFPTSASLITIEIAANQVWKGVNSVALGLAQYRSSGEYIFQAGTNTRLDVEAQPRGTTAKITWGPTIDGPWSDVPSSDPDEFPVTLAGTTVMGVSSNLSTLLTMIPNLTMGSELWLGPNSYLFECSMNRSLIDNSAQPNSYQSWEALPPSSIYRGICSTASNTIDGIRVNLGEAPLGMSYHLSWFLYAPTEVTLRFAYEGQTYSSAGSETISYLGNAAGDDMLFSMYLNRGKVTPGTEVEMTLPRGVSQFDLYGQVRNGASPGDRYSLHLGLTTSTISDTGVVGWYAVRVPYIESFSAPSRGHDNGLTNPSFHTTDTQLITTVNAGWSRVIESPWGGPDTSYIPGVGLIHNPQVAKLGLLRIPNQSRSYAKVSLWGGEYTPLVRKVSRR